MPKITLAEDHIICFRCKQEKPTEQFVQAYLLRKWPHKLCSDCNNKAKHERYSSDLIHRAKEIGISSRWQKNNKDKVKARNSTWQKNHKEQVNRYQREYYLAHHEIKMAHRKIKRAKGKGNITEKPCAVCGVLPTHAHHPDYSYPLQIAWLCPQHHVEVHRNENRTY